MVKTCKNFLQHMFLNSEEESLCLRNCSLLHKKNSRQIVVNLCLCSILSGFKKQTTQEKRKIHTQTNNIKNN